MELASGVKSRTGCPNGPVDLVWKGNQNSGAACKVASCFPALSSERPEPGRKAPCAPGTMRNIENDLQNADSDAKGVACFCSATLVVPALAV